MLYRYFPFSEAKAVGIGVRALAGAYLLMEGSSHSALTKARALRRGISMGSIVSSLFGNRAPAIGRGVAGKSKSDQVVLRGRSKRAYAFEVHAREAIGGLDVVPAVYIYARSVPAGSVASTGDGNGGGFNVGYVGRTDGMSRQDAEHARLKHFEGHGFDVVLIMRIEQDAIRRDIEADLIEAFSPVLNDLLRGYNRAELAS
jgi:hypothetical protein